MASAFPRNPRTLVEREIVETAKEKRLRDTFKLMNYAYYSWHFSSQVPPPERLSESECRVAWQRDLQDETIEKVTRKVLNRKTGKTEDQKCMYIPVMAEGFKDMVASEKRQSSIVTTKGGADNKALERSRAHALSFLSMSGDDDFFQTLSMDFLGKLTLDADGTEITTEAEAAR
ncbi:unnamed protein product, partial [Durusdinium trenchii]